jgi:dTDP-4-dehydrorhamnose reductase
MKRILVTGSAGFIGSGLFNSLEGSYEMHGVSRRASPTTTVQHDIIQPDTSKLLGQINPDIIIHCAAISNVDYCELNPEIVARHNVETTKHLADWAGDNKRKLVFISTDYVYPGETNDYEEGSKLGPVNRYGITKMQAEEFVRGSVENHLILRPTVVFDWIPGDKNFLSQMVSLKESRRIPVDQISNPTYMGVLKEYVSRSLSLGLKGTYVATGPEQIDRLSFAYQIMEAFGIDKGLLTGVETSHLGQSAKRPLKNGTNSALLRKVLDFECPSLEDSIREASRNGR